MNDESKENIRFGFGITIEMFITILLIIVIVTLCGGYP